MPDFLMPMFVLIGFAVLAVVIAAIVCALMGRRQSDAGDTLSDGLPHPLPRIDIDLSDSFDVRRWPKVVDTGERRRRTDFADLDELDRGIR